jgi:hypothetical protein
MASMALPRPAMWDRDKPHPFRIMALHTLTLVSPVHVASIHVGKPTPWLRELNRDGMDKIKRIFRDETKKDEFLGNLEQKIEERDENNHRRWCHRSPLLRLLFIPLLLRRC